MAYEIIWLPKAEKRYHDIIKWLEQNWTDKEISNFISKTESVLESIRLDPEMYRKSERRNIRQAIVTKHNLLLYTIKGNRIELVGFFDTRQNPSKKFK